MWPVLALAAGCVDFGLDPVDPDPVPARVVLHDQFVQSPLPAVDLLLVIDDTASMAQEQAALASQFSALAGGLDDAGIAWQAGVVTTEMTGDHAGWLLGTPFVVTPDTPDVEAAFARAVQVGVDGAGPEAGLASAALALDLADGGANTGFRRPEAALHVVFVSDDDDHSDAWLGSDPEGRFLGTLRADEATTGLPARASAVVGDVPDGCASEAGTARPGRRYADLAEATGGVVASICAADFGPLVRAIGEASIVYRTSFPLEQVPSDVTTVRVSVDDVRVTDGWTYDDAQNAVVFDEAPAADAVVDVSYVVEVDG